jgi:flagellar biosynthetic protein FliR
MLSLTVEQLSAFIASYLWPFFRIAGFLGVVPLIGTRLVPQRIRILLALLITLIVHPFLPDMPDVEPLSMASFVIILQQVMIGACLGFIVETLMQVFVIAGQMIAMQTGLGMATLIDPSNGVSVAIVSQWFLFFVSFLFLAMNGHLVVLSIVIDSFQSIPIGQGLSGQWFLQIVQWGSWMFAAALSVSIPALTALLMVNLTFGVMNRAAQQLNVFALGFPVAMMFGLFILWAFMATIIGHFDRFTMQLFNFMQTLIC